MTDNHTGCIEFTAPDFDVCKAFYSGFVCRTFTETGSAHTAYSNSDLEGGSEPSDEKVVNRTLIVLYHNTVKLVRRKITESGGKISKDIFVFPGGTRFHFTDPTENVLAV